MEPDLIIGLYTGMTEKDYGLLSRIAPTVAQAGEFGDYEMPWQEMTRVVGRALGRSEQAEQLIAGVDEPRVRLLTDLGFTIPDRIAAVAGDGAADLSDERMDLLDADVLVWTFLEAGELDANPLYQRTRVAREGRALMLDRVLGGALAWGTVLSLPFALDGLVPRLAAAVDGDPATEVIA